MPTEMAAPPGCPGCGPCAENPDLCGRCGQCAASCCDCAECGDCSAACAATCGHCGNCDQCCRCAVCDRCGDPVSATCSICSRCDDCCECVRYGDCVCVGEDDDDGPRPPHAWLEAGSFARVTTRRYLSVELEVVDATDQARTREAIRRWGVASVGDCSIEGDAERSAACGFELNTPPAQGDRFAEMIDDLAAALAADDAHVNRSCGYHVHVDARDLDEGHVANLIRAYARIEPALLETVAPSRRRSDACERCGDMLLRRLDLDPAESVADRVAYAVYGESRGALARARRDKYRAERYRALNLHSWYYRGTIECRLHQGTVNATKVIPWAHLWGAIVDFARAGDPAALPADPWAALMAVAPTDDVRRHLAARRDHFAGRD